MYERIEFEHGRLEGLAVLVNTGTGMVYRVLVSALTADAVRDYFTSKAKGIPDCPATLHLHHVIDAERGEEKLFGFWTVAERELFQLLISVSGIGYTTAMRMLCKAAPGEIYTALAAGDTVALKKIKGIGPKLAERMVSELRERAALAAPGVQAITSAIAQHAATAEGALKALGYTVAESRAAVSAVVALMPGNVTVEELVKAALQRL